MLSMRNGNNIRRRNGDIRFSGLCLLSGTDEVSVEEISSNTNWPTNG